MDEDDEEQGEFESGEEESVGDTSAPALARLLPRLAAEDWRAWDSVVAPCLRTEGPGAGAVLAGAAMSGLLDFALGPPSVESPQRMLEVVQRAAPLLDVMWPMSSDLALGDLALEFRAHANVRLAQMCARGGLQSVAHQMLAPILRGEARGPAHVPVSLERVLPLRPAALASSMIRGFGVAADMLTPLPGVLVGPERGMTSVLNPKMLARGLLLLLQHRVHGPVDSADLKVLGRAGCSLLMRAAGPWTVPAARRLCECLPRALCRSPPTPSTGAVADLSEARSGELAMGATHLMLLGDSAGADALPGADALATAFIRRALRVEPAAHVQKVDVMAMASCALAAMACQEDFHHAEQILLRCARILPVDNWDRWHTMMGMCRARRCPVSAQDIAARMLPGYDPAGEPLDLTPRIRSLGNPYSLRVVLDAVWGRQCLGCGRLGCHFWRCARCQKARYCSRRCQKSHWRRVHRRQCRGAG